MTRKRIIRHAGLAAAALCLPLFVGSAFAERGDRDRGHRHRDHPRAHRDRDYDRGKRYDRQHNRPKVGFEFNVSFGKGYRDRGRHHRRGHYDRGYDRGYKCGRGSAYILRNDRCGGYWKRVWCPPVYRTYYDGCGRKVRKCIKAGYWKRVYVRY